MNKKTTKKELAQILGLTTRRIEQLAKEKIIEKGIDGLFDLQHSAANYIKNIKNPESSIDIAKEKARLIKFQAEKAELNLQHLKGELISKQETLDKWCWIMSKFKSCVLSLPGKLTPQIIALNGNYSKINKLLESEMIILLNELSMQDDKTSSKEPKPTRENIS